MRQFKRGFLLMGLPLLLAAMVWGESATSVPATMADESEIEKLLPALRASAFAAREKALAELMALGPKSMPAIKKFTAVEGDPEAKSRLQKAYDALEEQVVLVGDLVTMDVKNASPTDIIKEISRQSGKEFSIGPEAADKKLDFKVTRLPALLALAELRKKYPFNVTERGNIEMGSPGIFQVSTDGAVALCGGDISRQGITKLGEAGTTWTSKLSIHFLLSQDVRIEEHLLLQEISDERGNILLPAPERGEQDTNAGRGDSALHTDFDLNLKTPENAGGTIKEIRGRYTMTAATRRQTLSIPYGDSAGHVIAGIAASMKWDLQPNGELRTQMTLNYGNNPQDAFHRIYQSFGSRSEPSFHDESGNEISVNKIEGEGESEKTSYVLTSVYTPTPAQLAAIKKGALVFSFSVPDRTKTINLDFSIPKVPYPK